MEDARAEWRYIRSEAAAERRTDGGPCRATRRRSDKRRALEQRSLTVRAGHRGEGPSERGGRSSGAAVGQLADPAEMGTTSRIIGRSEAGEPQAVCVKPQWSWTTDSCWSSVTSGCSLSPIYVRPRSLTRFSA